MGWRHAGVVDPLAAAGLQLRRDPVVHGRDALWETKRQRGERLLPEPARVSGAGIHMPNPSYWPLVSAVGVLSVFVACMLLGTTGRLAGRRCGGGAPVLRSVPLGLRARWMKLNVNGNGEREHTFRHPFSHRLLFTFLGE